MRYHERVSEPTSWRGPRVHDSAGREQLDVTNRRGPWAMLLLLLLLHTRVKVGPLVERAYPNFEWMYWEGGGIR